MLFTVKIKGQDYKVDAESAEQAAELGEKEAAKGPVTRGVESVGTGLRSAGEGALGITGSGGSMLGGAARWGAQQANKILPQSLEMDPQGVGQQQQRRGRDEEHQELKLFLCSEAAHGWL